MKVVRWNDDDSRLMMRLPLARRLEAATVPMDAVAPLSESPRRLTVNSTSEEVEALLDHRAEVPVSLLLRLYHRRTLTALRL